MGSRWSDFSLRCLSLAFVAGFVCFAVVVPRSDAQTAHFSYASRALGSGFDQPRGVAVNAGGAVYIADQGNSTVKKMPAGCTSSTCLTTLGGGFNAPKGVAVDPGGVVYVADTNNNAVKKMAAGCASSACVTMLGAGFTLPTGIAVAKGVVYVAEGYPNNDVKKMPAGCVSSTCVTTVGGGFSGPTGVAVDASGNVYVADFPINAVKEVPAGCESSSCVVSLGGGFNRPAGVAVDASGTVFVADRDNDAVKEIPSGCSSSACATTLVAGFSSPTGIAIDGSGDVFLADTGHKAVKDIMTQGVNFFSRPVGSPSPVVSLTFTFDSAGTIQAPAVLTKGAADVDFTDAGTGTCTTNGVSHTYNAGDTCTVNVAYTPKYAGMRNGAAVLMDSTGGHIATAFVYGIAVGPQLTFNPTVLSMGSTDYPQTFVNPQTMAVDGNGNVYVGDSSDHGLKEIPRGCTNTSCVSIVEWFNYGVSGVAVDGSGEIYASNGVNSIWKFAPDCTSSTCAVVLELPYAQGVAVDGAGNVYASQYYEKRVVRMPAGCITYACVTAIGGGFNKPVGIAVDDSGNVFVTDTVSPGNLVVKEIPAGCASSACVSTVWTDGHPWGVAVDGNGNIYVASFSSSSTYPSVYMIPPGCHSISCAAGLGIYRVSAGVAVDDRGNVYVAEQNADLVGIVSRLSPPSLSFATTAPGAESSDSPKKVTLTNIGNAALTLPVPASGTNPSLANGFALDSLTTCPEVSTGSASASLAPGASCTYAVDFKPPAGGFFSGALALTDNALNAPAPGYVTQKVPLSGHAYTPPAMTSPAPNSVLSGSSATFTWSKGTGVQQYQLELGTTGAGSSNVYSGASMTGTSVTVSNIPTNGVYLYATLLYEIGSTWYSNHYVYTEAGTMTPPAMTAPPPGSSLSGSTATFTWTAGGGPVAYELKIGDTGAGSSDIYDSGAITATSATVSNIPTLGQKLYVRLLYEVNNTWKSIDYTYTEY